MNLLGETKIKQLFFMTLLFPITCFSSITYADENDSQSEWHFIHYKQLTQKEQLDLIELEKQEAIARAKAMGLSEEHYGDYINFEYFDKALEQELEHFRLLDDQEVTANFSELRGLIQPKFRRVGFWSIQAIAYDYKSEIISLNELKTRILDCRVPETDDIKLGLKCRYISKFSYFTDNPWFYFEIVGDIDKKLAVKIAEAWGSRENLSGYEIREHIPKYISRLSFQDGTYEVSYQADFCGGSTNIKPSVDDDKVSIEVLDEVQLWCP